MKKNDFTTETWLHFIGKDKLQTFQDMFSKVHNVGMAFFDLDDKPLTVYSKESLFCHTIQRDNMARCEEHWLSAKANIQRNNVAKFFACPFGITYIYVPIFFGDKLMAYAYCGGITNNDSKIPQALRDRYHLPSKSKGEIEELCFLLESMSKLLNLDYSMFFEKKKNVTVNLPTKLRDNRISRREHEIVELLCQGMSNKQIAATLFISETTVKTHVSNILAKLNLHDRMQIVVHYYGKIEADKNGHS